MSLRVTQDLARRVREYPKESDDLFEIDRFLLGEPGAARTNDLFEQLELPRPDAHMPAFERDDGLRLGREAAIARRRPRRNEGILPPFEDEKAAGEMRQVQRRLAW